MFTIKASSSYSNNALQKHYMKPVSVIFSKDEFESKKDVKNYYATHYKKIGIALDINNKEFWNENADSYFIQACELTKTPEQTIAVEIDDCVKILFAANKIIIKDEKEIKTFEDKVKKFITSD